MEVSATDCVARHAAEKARQGCELHRAFHSTIAQAATDGYRCVASGCGWCFPTRLEAFTHLETAQDAQHAECRIAERDARHERAAVELQRPVVRAGLDDLSVAVAASAVGADPAAADRERAEEEQQRRQEAAAAASLYSAAKMGHEAAVARHLAAGADPNAMADDGFTPLMTCAHAAAQTHRWPRPLRTQSAHAPSALSAHLPVVLAPP